MPDDVDLYRLPQPGDYGVTAGGGFAMRIVRDWTASRDLTERLARLRLPPTTFGHAAMCYARDGDGIVIAEATPDKDYRIRDLRLDEYERGRWLWSGFDLSGSQRAALVEAMGATVGRPYDWPSIALFLGRHWGSNLLHRSLRRNHPDSHLMCSEAVCWMWRDFAGFDLFPRFAPDTRSPNDLADVWLTEVERRRGLRR